MLFNKALTAEQRLTKAVVAIMDNPKYIALSGVLMLGSKRIEPDEAKCPTAYTNGRDEVYGEKFVDALNDAELRFVVLHECYHKLYRHMTTWKHLFDKHAMAANMACDYVINLKIVDENKDNFATPPNIGVCLDEKYRDWDSARVFNDLMKQAQEQQGNGGAGKGKGDKSGGMGNGKPLDAHGWEEAEAMDAEEAKQLERDIDAAIRQGALAAGKVGSGGDVSFADLLETKVNWREVLREFISSFCSGNDYSTWRRPNRRFVGAGHYLPSGVSESVGELVLAVDTSGSIGDTELGQFLGEVKAIAETVKPERVRLLYWDTKVAREEVYEQGELASLIQSTKPAGGGGTMVECVPAYIAKHGIKPQAIIVLTDGYLGGSWGQWSHPVLWCIKGSNAKPSVGKYVYVKD